METSSKNKSEEATEPIKMEDCVDSGDYDKICNDSEDRKDVVTNLHHLDDASTDISREATNYSQDIDANDDSGSFTGVKDEPIEMEEQVDNSNDNMHDDGSNKKIVPNLLRIDAKTTDMPEDTTNYSQLNTDVFCGSKAQRHRDYIVPEICDESDPNEEVDSGDEYEPQSHSSSSSEEEHEELPKESQRVSVKQKNIRKQVQEQELIAKYKSGVCVAELARMYGTSASTISSILVKKKEIKEADVAKGVNVLTKQRLQTIEHFEMMLWVWIDKKQLAGDSVSEAIICEKARELHANLERKMPGTSAAVSEFKASRGWFDRFKKRTGIHYVERHGKTASLDKRGAEEFVDGFKEYVKAEGFLPKQVFNCDETGLFWKKMPKRTYITQEEKALQGHKPMKDRLTLLLCGNASGDFKVKPLLVYHSENPQVFKKNNIIRSKLSVMWKANSKAWVTKQIFIEWVNEVFGPSVKKYLLKNQLPLKCLLLMDSAPAHPPGLEDHLLEEFSFITVKFFPPNTTPLIQPMDQQVISNFKKLYTKALFQRCFNVTFDTELTLREFWRNHFSILHCISLIDKAWQGVTSRTMNCAWRKLWPECVLKKVFGGFEADAYNPTPVVESIVSLGESMGLDVNGQDVEELVDDHREELTTDELQDLQLELQQIIAEEIASEEKERGEIVPSSVIKDMCAKWNRVQNFVEKHLLDKAVAGRACNMVNDKVMSHFRQILMRRQKQTSLDRFFVRQGSSDSQAGPSASKRQRREVTPDRA
nr:tigger transposable element-derived protein 1-like isoform X3 [Cherax quadricarinatus]